MNTKPTDAEKARYEEVERALEPYFPLIGKIAAKWASLENSIDTLIWQLAGVSQAAGACITAQLIGPGKRFDAVVTLVRHYGGSDDLAGRVRSIAGQVTALGEERNRVVHDSWVVDNKSKTVARFQVTARKELQFGVVPEFLERLEHVKNKIRDMIDLIEDLRSEILRA